MQDSSETAERLVQRFLQPPLWSDRYTLGAGTLYTACYRPEHRDLTLLWRDGTMRQSLHHFIEGTHPIELGPT